MDQASETGAKRLPPEVRRGQLVEAALEVFARQGFNDTEMEDIASAAGVGRPLLYHYFPEGKEDLYVATVELAWQKLLERLEVDPDRGPEIVAVNLGTFLDLTEAGDPASALVGQSRRVDSERVREASREAGGVFVRAIAANQLGTSDPSPLALTGLVGFLGFLETVLEEWRLGAISRPELERLVTGTLAGIVEALDAGAEPS